MAHWVKKLKTPIRGYHSRYHPLDQILLLFRKVLPMPKQGGISSRQKTFFFILFLRQKNYSFWYFIYVWQSSGKGKESCFSEKKGKAKVTSKRKTSTFTLSLVSSYIIWNFKCLLITFVIPFFWEKQTILYSLFPEL